MWIESLFNLHRDIDHGNGILYVKMKRFRLPVLTEKNPRN